MNDKKHHIHTANSATCDWIWSTLFARWLRVEQAKVFWIEGKPGSGKSTLMKYLSHPNVLRDMLPKCSGEWIVIDFFFDFRLAEKTGNSLEGLLKSLLHQMVRVFPGVSEALYPILDNATESSLESLKGAFGQALALAKRKFLVLVDGLDEYTGKYKPLIEQLLSIKRYQYLKLCLASRPEPMIREMLEIFPRISMSEHNARGIEKYVCIAVKEFEPQLDALLLPNIKELILARADGVFLWVHLALDEILEACVGGATPAELHQKLDVLPTELEQLYKRILDRIEPSRKCEAAIIFTLINDANPPITLSLLHHTMNFLAQELGIMYLPVEVTSIKHFERRLHGTMRGLVDLLPETNEQVEDGSPKSSTVRLVHETLRSYSKRSACFENCLASDFRQVFPSCMWLRICSRALLTANIYLANSSHGILSSLQGTKIGYHDFAALITQNSLDEGIANWIVLLHHSVIYIPCQANEMASTNDQGLKTSVERSMQSPIASIHYTLVGDHHRHGLQPKRICFNLEVSDLMLAAAHRGYEYLNSRRNRIALLSDEERGELVTMIILVAQRHRNCPGACLDTEREGSKTKERLVDTILSSDEHISAFHLGVYIRLSYEDIPTFVLRHLMRGQQCPSTPPKIPSWVRTTPLFAAELPLYIWVCEYNGNGSRNLDAQLQVLASFGLDINSKCSTGQNIVHYIIIKHVIGHTFLIPLDECACWASNDIRDAVDEIYAIERAGADFSEQFEHRTPLQALRYGLDLVRKAKVKNYDDIPEARFSQLEFMLEHKEITGHLPQPMVGKEFIESKHIPLILERKCDLCSSKPPSLCTRTQSPTSSITNSILRPRIPQPSRIPRPRARVTHSNVSH